MRTSISHNPNVCYGLQRWPLSSPGRETSYTPARIRVVMARFSPGAFSFFLLIEDRRRREASVSGRLITTFRLVQLQRRPFFEKRQPVI